MAVRGAETGHTATLKREHATSGSAASEIRRAARLATCPRAKAALDGRDFVIPDDVKDLAADALAHRLILSPELWSKRVTDRDIIASVVQSVPVPKVS